MVVELASSKAVVASPPRCIPTTCTVQLGTVADWPTGNGLSRLKPGLEGMAVGVAVSPATASLVDVSAGWLLISGVALGSPSALPASGVKLGSTTATAGGVEVKVLLGSTVKVGFNVRVGRGVRLGLSATNQGAVEVGAAGMVGAGGLVGVAICATDVLLAQALSNNEDRTAARASSLKLCFIFILSILLNSFTGMD